MKTLIAYGTKYGSTEKCANILLERLNGEVDLCNLKETKNVDLSKYDKVVIGGSIYMGKIQKAVSQFCITNLDVLREKKIGLYICCMRDGDIAETEIKESFPLELVNDAVVKGYFGGEFIITKMNFLERFIVKKIAKINIDTSNISVERISDFADLINNS